MPCAVSRTYGAAFGEHDTTAHRIFIFPLHAIVRLYTAALSCPAESAREDQSEYQQRSEKTVSMGEKAVLEEGVWSPCFFSSTVGINEEVIKRYVEFQEKVDKGKLQVQLSSKF